MAAYGGKADMNRSPTKGQSRISIAAVCGRRSARWQPGIRQVYVIQIQWNNGRREVIETRRWVFKGGRSGRRQTAAAICLRFLKLRNAK